MALDILTEAPKAGDFIPLREHQEQTPGSFFLGKPVLHLHCPQASIWISADELNQQDAFAQLYSGESARTEVNGGTETSVEVWVTSRYLAIWSSGASKGVQIKYPTITVHAQDGDAVLLELNLSDSNTTADEDIEHLQLRIKPIEIGRLPPHMHEGIMGPVNGHAPQGGMPYVLYHAIGDCQELNPDPRGMDDDEDGEEDEWFDETAPGATGWITSENMQDFVDEDGNFRMPEGATVIGGEGGAEEGQTERLGPGAGRTRTADELDGDDEDEGKWQRTG